MWQTMKALFQTYPNLGALWEECYLLSHMLLTHFPLFTIHIHKYNTRSGCVVVVAVLGQRIQSTDTNINVELVDGALDQIR
jgi:hypothetical protein